ncbi:MAG TPA: OmpA family protein [Bacteroidia bacterium]|nr:OmpA family protein [Bacteroidia bacterium]
MPNSSFEEYNSLPTSPGDAKETIKDWKIANEQGGGDYYHVDSPSKNCQAEQNYFGSEAPHSGKAYAGFCVTPQYREFLACQLKTPLVKGKQYRISLFISHGDKKSVSYLKEIGVLFLKKEFILPFGIPMSLPPQIVFYQDTGFTQHDGWQELSAVYTANGTEQWMYIGGHEWQCDTCKSVPGAPRKENPYIFGGIVMKEAHYYVDDVSVTEIIPEEIKTGAPDTTETFVTGQVYTFNNIHFANNSAVLEKGDQPDLEKILAYLKANPGVSVSVFGYTDNVGSEEDNLRLSLARAQAVKNYFMENGIEEDRISAEGFGEFHPVATNDTEAGRALNRRVQFLFDK